MASQQERNPSKASNTIKSPNYSEKSEKPIKTSFKKVKIVQQNHPIKSIKQSNCHSPSQHLKSAIQDFQHKNKQSQNSNQDQSIYGKNYCVDFHKLFRKISNACQGKKTTKNKKQSTESFQLNSPVIVNQQISNLPLESNTLSTFIEINQNQQFIQEQKTDQKIVKNYPLMIHYSEIQYMSVEDKIKYHLDALEHLVIFKEYNCGKYSQKKQLKFLIEKKYYCERKKIQKFMKKFPIVSPFKFKKGKISTQEMLRYIKTQSCCELIKQISKQNAYDLKNLSESYHLLKPSHSSFINLQFQSNFEREIFRMLQNYLEQIQAELKERELTIEETQKQNYCMNIARIIQIGFIIGQLLEIDEILGIELSESYISAGMLKSYIKQYRKQFEKMILKTKV